MLKLNVAKSYIYICKNTQVDKAKDEGLHDTPEFSDLQKQLIRIRREFCVVLIIEHAMTRGAFTAEDGARNVDVKHLKGALARADLIKSFQPHYQQRVARARMLLDLRECIQVLTNYSLSRFKLNSSCR